MKSNTLIIHWNDDVTNRSPQYFKNVKSLEAAIKIVGKRNITNIYKAIYYPDIDKPISIHLSSINCNEKKANRYKKVRTSIRTFFIKFRTKRVPKKL